MKLSIKRELFFKVSVAAVARLLLFTKIRINDFYKDLKIELVKQAQLKGSKTALNISIQTGIDRRQVSQLINGEDELYVKPNKLDLIIRELFYYQSINNIKFIQESDFNSICKRYCNGTFTRNTIIEELENQGIIKVGNGQLLIKNNSNNYKNNLKQVDTIQEDLFESLVSNIVNTSDQESFLCKSNYTTKISPLKITKVQKEISTKLASFQLDIEKTIKRHEAKVAENTFPKYGLSIFDYKM